MNIKHSNDSISAIVGTMLLLIIAISTLSIIYIQVLSDDGPTPLTFIRVEGKVEGKQIIVEHMGGEAIDNQTWIKMVLPDEDVNVRIDELLNDTNNNGLWNIGERLIKPFEYNLSRIDEYTASDIIAVHEKNNCIVFMGPVSFNPVSDVSVDITVNNTSPSINEMVSITITVESLGGDINASGDVHIEYIIPNGLTFVSSNATHGLYNNSTGMWHVGNVLVEKPATLTIKAQVVGVGNRPFTQYCVLLDGSGSISSTNWEIMTDGLAMAVENGDLPHDESIELTVVQFSGYKNPNTRAEVEINITLITESNYLTIADQIRSMEQMVDNYHRGGTPTGCAFYLGADILHSSLNFSALERQAITLVTDGLPTWCCDFDDDLYIADSSGYGCDEYESSENARDYMISTLFLDEEQDEIDAIAIGDSLDIDWLCDNIVWPQPGNDTWPPNNPGWVREVKNEVEFAETIDDIFYFLFSGIKNEVSYYSSTTIDVNVNNDKDKITIIPQE